MIITSMQQAAIASLLEEVNEFSFIKFDSENGVIYLAFWCNSYFINANIEQNGKVIVCVLKRDDTR